jgi:glycosyltransferase involved in cell wall biosynthesis
MLCDVDFGFPDATRTHTIEVARAFAAEGLAVDLVARGPAPDVYEGIDYHRANGAETQRARRLATLNRCAITLLWRRRRTARRFYVRDNWSCFPAMLAAKALGYRIVNQVDGIPYGPDFDGNRAIEALKRTVAILSGRLAIGSLAVTPQIKRLLVEIAHVPAERIAVIPNGVDLEFFAPRSREEAINRLGLDPNLRYAVFCGGFHPWSDFRTMLEAFATVVRERPDARLLLVGDGPEREHIEELRRQLDIEATVILPGLVHKRDVVRDYLAAATVTLLIYHQDKLTRTSASPIKLTEYLASGRAVVAVDIPGVREILDGHRAGIVVSDDARDLAQAMLKLLDPAVADELGRGGRSYAEERLSWRSVVQQTLRLFAL